MKLTRLEATVISEMAACNPRDRDAIEYQIAKAQVTKRENTGAGFYTHLEVEHPIKQIDARVISRVSAEVHGLNNPMVFVLFVENGVMKLLEGAAVIDDTTSIKFEKADFTAVWSF
jgi:hypothetical protein